MIRRIYNYIHFWISFVVVKGFIEPKARFIKPKKIREVYAGWKNYIWENPMIEDMAKRRLEVCGKCPLMVPTKAKLKDNRIKGLEGYKCGGCGCPLSSKLRSPQSFCPKGKWLSERIN